MRYDPYPYKPTVDERNAKLAEKSRERWQEERDGATEPAANAQVPNRLMAPKLSPRWVNEEQKKKLREERK